MQGNVIEDFLFKYRWPILSILVNVILVGVSVLFSVNSSSPSVEVLESDGNAVKGVESSSIIIVEISGAVSMPGVYELGRGSRINDLINVAGGLTGEDKQWVERFVNKAQILIDGQKIYIQPGDHSTVESAKDGNGYQTVTDTGFTSNINYININTASRSELESLWGIGPVYAQNIVDQRPYSSVEELLDKGIVKSNVYERNKDILTVY